MDLLGIIGSDADDLLRKGQRIIIQDVLTQWRSEAGEKTGRLLNVNVEPRPWNHPRSARGLLYPRRLKVFEFELTHNSCPETCFG
jgi:hypothetical protein